jgi:hypothetical protein
MIRALKTISTANWILAVLFVGGYIIYGLATGLRIDQNFLGHWPAPRGDPPRGTKCVPRTCSDVGTRQEHHSRSVRPVAGRHRRLACATQAKR